MSGPRIFFTGIVLYVVFGFPRVFLVFGSGSFYRLLGPPKPKNLEENQKKQRILGNVWAKDFVQRHCFFCFFWFSSSFFGFWFRKLLSATRATKTPNTSRKTQKQKKRGFSGMPGPRTFFRGIIIFVLSFLV